MPSETQRILTPAAFGVLGFAISILTNRLLKLGILCIPKRFLIFYRSTQPTSMLHSILEPTLT